MWRSSEAVRSICESGEKHKLRTDIAWPSNVWTTFPAWTSKMLIIPSRAPDAIYFPSGLYARLSVNFPFWGSRTCSAFPLSTLYIEIFPSFDPEITYLLSGENAIVHKSTGPREIWFKSFPLSAFHKHKVESNELLAISRKRSWLETTWSQKLL